MIKRLLIWHIFGTLSHQKQKETEIGENR